MTIFLRQSTASQEILLGRFVDSTDGNTEETALSIANTDIKVWKTGATTLASKNSGGATHIANGVYYCVLDATDTDTIGPLVLHVHVSGALYVKQDCMVLDEAMYDWWTGTAAPLAPTTAGRTLDVSAGGEAGIDWANIGSPTTTVGLSGTTVKTATDVETDTADIQTRLPAALTGGGNIKADALAISGDTVAADNAEAFFDGTGYAGTNNVIPVVTGVTGLTTATIAAAVWAYVVEGSYTALNYIRIFASALAGKGSGLETTTAIYRDTGDTKNRITATVDADGNRTAITLDGS